MLLRLAFMQRIPTKILFRRLEKFVTFVFQLVTVFVLTLAFATVIL